MATMFVNVEVGDTPPSASVMPGVGLAVDAWLASRFVRVPAKNANPPDSSTADASGTTDASGNVSLAGLTAATYYWIRVIDARGVSNWFPNRTFQAGTSSGDRFVCEIPWSTPTSATSPLDDRGGDTAGGATQQGLWAPRTHIHQIPASAPSTLWPQKFLAAQITGWPANNWNASAMPGADAPLQNTLTVPVVCYGTWHPASNSVIPSALEIKGSDDGVIYVILAEGGNSTFGSVSSVPNVAQTWIVPPNAWWQWHDTGSGFWDPQFFGYSY